MEAKVLLPLDFLLALERDEMRSGFSPLYGQLVQGQTQIGTDPMLWDRSCSAFESAAPGILPAAVWTRSAGASAA
jgi:hypothetical protein